MSRFQLVHIASIDDLRAAAPAWDDLWRRSAVTLPTVRAELIAQWTERFAPQADFHALVVEDRRQWVAALPLVHRRIARVIGAGGTPSNEWSASGELLLDTAAEPHAALDVLVAGIRELPWQLLRLEDVIPDAPRWKAFLEALARAAVPADYHEQLQIGRIDIDHDWQAYKMRWSRRHRQQMARYARRLSQEGHVQLVMHSQLPPEQVEALMRRGFEVEDRSWKGVAGTSVLRSPGMFDFFCRQAEQLARWGQLELAFLECGSHPIAFAYGLTAKGVYHSYKTGYDPRYATYSPGQLLRYYLFEHFFSQPQRRAIDYMAPTDAHRKWRPTIYAAGRLILAPRGLLGRTALRAYKCCHLLWPLVGGDSVGD